MKTKPSFKPLILAVCLTALMLPGQANADTVIVTATLSADGSVLNGFPPYLEDTTFGTFFTSSGKSTAPGVPQFGTRFGVSGYPSVIWAPTLGTPGGVYEVSCTLPTSSSIPSDVTTELSVSGGTLSTNKTLAFGGPQNEWNFVCYITNDAGVTMPELTMTYSSNLIDGVTAQAPCGFGRRWYTGPMRFTEITDPCLTVPDIPQVTGPLAEGQTNVFVPGVSSNATAVTVYADDIQIGSLPSGVVEGLNSVPVSALVKGQEIKATQTIGGQESCLQPLGVIVGGGANPQLRVSFSFRQDANAAGPVGADGGATSTDIYFLPAIGASGGFGTAPLGGIVLTPSTNWQTITVQNGIDFGYFWDGTGAMPDPNPFAILESIALCVEDLTDTGPFNIYIDNVMNGTNVIQDFESATNGEPAVLFNQPRFSGSTDGSLLGAPDVSRVTTDTSDTGSKSAQISWQFREPLNTFWVRLTTQGSGTPNPMVDLLEPISLRILLLPVGETVTPPPTPGMISIRLDGDQAILNWDGSFTLQNATNVVGPFDDVPGPVTTGPHTNEVTGKAEEYFRLRN